MTNEFIAEPENLGLTAVSALSTSALVTALIEHLGLRLVAYLGGANEVVTVRQWSQGTSTISDTDTIERLRLALGAAEMITAAASSGLTQAWFQGLNPALNDMSPASLLRNADTDTIRPKILAAARRCAAPG
ncbi:hypothetical protein [Mycobacteroides chelonae]|uniref:hypothetical protein n=1 Tax=Mycobacteroides chelonae TaxID=1774 RepID=UPI001C2C55C7|nr:hypothetical protein [Mycobacteroides chelonae]MBV0920591.1 hypothetical protein [Mycobacteroides chelonae]MEC4903387.1 hypothetical protein [Mycobacteroides chelonae]